MRFARPVATALALAWCGLGAIHSVRDLAGPAGWRVQRPEGSEGAVGMPLPGAGAVTAVRALLPQPARHEGPWLLVLLDGTDPFVMTYVRYQLAHLEYPRRVLVMCSRAAPPAGPYAGIITGPGVRLTGPWRTVAERAGFTRHTQEAR